MADADTARDPAIVVLDCQCCSETGKSDLVAYGGTPLLTGDRWTCLLSNRLP